MLDINIIFISAVGKTTPQGHCTMTDRPVPRIRTRLGLTQNIKGTVTRHQEQHEDVSAIHYSNTVSILPRHPLGKSSAWPQKGHRKTPPLTREKVPDRSSSPRQPHGSCTKTKDPFTGSSESESTNRPTTYRNDVCHGT